MNYDDARRDLHSRIRLFWMVFLSYLPGVGVIALALNINISVVRAARRAVGSWVMDDRVPRSDCLSGFISLPQVREALFSQLVLQPLLPKMSPLRPAAVGYRDKIKLTHYPPRTSTGHATPPRASLDPQIWRVPSHR
jgi:hypothetical protein